MVKLSCVVLAPERRDKHKPGLVVKSEISQASSNGKGKIVPTQDLLADIPEGSLLDILNSYTGAQVILVGKLLRVNLTVTIQLLVASEPSRRLQRRKQTRMNNVRLQEESVRVNTFADGVAMAVRGWPGWCRHWVKAGEKVTIVCFNLAT
ncbi:hypothetical protein JB92DRAFT_2836907 [Gautieria morchelliformis]|nr:hypothetical protein JB92DRAFT_2836907 [Gautieria morchelliformis]